MGGCRDSGPVGGDALAAAITAAAPPRLLEARLAGVERHAHCDTTHGSPGRCAPLPDPGTRAFTRLAQATERVRRAAGAGGGPLRAVGLAELVWHDGPDGALDRAVEALGGAAAADRGDWRAPTDLAAAFLARSAARGDLLDALHALDALERSRDPGAAHPPWLFNYALSLERLGLWSAAAAAWTAYVTRERSPGWRAEGEARGARATDVAQASATDPHRTIEEAVALGDSAWIATLAARHPRHARELTLRSLALRAASGHGPGASGQPLEARLGPTSVLVQELADRSAADLITDLLAAQGGEPGAYDRLMAALGGYEAASARWDEGRHEEALALFTRARSDAADLSPALEAWATLAVGTAHLTLFRYADAARHFDAVLAVADASRHPLQVGRALWGLGLIAARTGNPEQGWQLLARAGALYRSSGETENAAFLLSTAAELLSQLGRPREAWPYRLEALAALSREPPSSRLHHALWLAAEAALAEGLPHAAAVLQDADVALGRTLGVEWLLAEALVRRAGVRERIGDRDGARSDLAEARRVAVGISGPEVRDRALADVWESEAALASASDPAAAALLLDSAIAVHRGVGNEVFVATALTRRARARAASGDSTAAAEDLEAAVRLVEVQRARITDGLLSTSFTEAWHTVFDAAVAFHAVEGRDPWTALAYAERSRRLFAAGGASGVGTPPGTLGGSAPLSGLAPEGTLLLQFVVTGPRVLRWAIRAGERRFDVLPQSADSVASLADAFTRGLRRGRIEATAVESLSRLLLPEGWITGASRIAVVPDGFLNALPFHALSVFELPGHGRGRPLLETTSVTVSTSFAFFMAGALTPEPPSSESALLVGNPLPAPGSRLPPLPGAEREVRALERLYGGGLTLLGAQATREALLAELDAHPTLHFAGHAFFDEESPDASYLAVAPGNPGEADRLYLRGLAGTSFSTLRLVVLSACASVAPTLGRGGGLWGLALPFLAGGVPSVVGSLWPVEDRATEALMTTFHAARLRGSGPAEALAEAQRQLMRSSDPALASPRAWAAYVVLGR